MLNGGLKQSSGRIHRSNDWLRLRADRCPWSRVAMHLRSIVPIVLVRDPERSVCSNMRSLLYVCLSYSKSAVTPSVIWHQAELRIASSFNNAGCDLIAPLYWPMLTECVSWQYIVSQERTIRQRLMRDIRGMPDLVLIGTELHFVEQQLA